MTIKKFSACENLSRDSKKRNREAKRRICNQTIKCIQKRPKLKPILGLRVRLCNFTFYHFHIVFCNRYFYYLLIVLRLLSTIVSFSCDADGKFSDFWHRFCSGKSFAVSKMGFSASFFSRVFD